MDATTLASYASRMAKKHIAWNDVDAGDGNAGSIKVALRASKPDLPTSYQMNVNRNHDPNVQFATVAHELGHLFLGHLGKDKYLSIPKRPALQHSQRELEAESLSYIVCERNGVLSRSDSYLSTHVKIDTTVNQIDLYQVMRAAGQVEALLGLTAHTRYERPQKAGHRGVMLLSGPADLSDPKARCRSARIQVTHPHHKWDRLRNDGTFDGTSINRIQEMQYSCGFQGFIRTPPGPHQALTPPYTLSKPARFLASRVFCWLRACHPES